MAKTEEKPNNLHVNCSEHLFQGLRSVPMRPWSPLSLWQEFHADELEVSHPVVDTTSP